MKAAVQEMRAKVVEASGSTQGNGCCIEEGKLGVLDYYNMRNIIADTQMRESISKMGEMKHPRLIKNNQCPERRVLFGTFYTYYYFHCD